MGASTFTIKVAARGADMPGLMRYLYGPGSANEHTNQHMIGGSPDLRFAYEGLLSKAEAIELGRVLESSWREQVADARMMIGSGVGGVVRSDKKIPGVFDEVSPSELAHVYHFSVSLPPGNDWTDQQFEIVASEVVRRMGFTEGEHDDLGCRWWAVRHGQSANGNEHVHVAVNLVREDGRRAAVPMQDYQRMQEIRRELERELEFVQPLHDRGQEPARGLPGYSMDEHRSTDKAGALAPDRVLLQQHLRAALVGARTEAEWIERAIDAPGVDLRVTRWKAGEVETAWGYSARIGDGRWLRATDIAPDLTLGKMRPRWEENETPESRARAVALWREDAPLEPVTEVPRATPHLDTAVDELTQWADATSALRDSDNDAWRQVERDLAGVSAALTTDLSTTKRETAAAVLRAAHVASQRAVPTRQELRVAPLHRPTAGPSRVQVAARQIQLALRAASLDSHPGWIAVMQQLARVARAAESARSARQELAAARQLAAAAVALEDTSRRLHDSYGGGDLEGLREAWATRETVIARRGAVEVLGGNREVPTTGRPGANGSRQDLGRGR